MTDRLNEIKKLLQEIEDPSNKNDSSSFQLLLVFIHDEVLKYNAKNKVPLQWKYFDVESCKDYKVYSDFIEKLDKQIRELK